MSTINRKAIRAKVRRRIRRKLSGTASRPRLAVYFSNRHVYAQIIDDTVGKTICSASTADASIADPSKLANRASATKVGNLIGERLHALADRQRQRRHRPGDGQRAGRPCHCLLQIKQADFDFDINIIDAVASPWDISPHRGHPWDRRVAALRGSAMSRNVIFSQPCYLFFSRYKKNPTSLHFQAVQPEDTGGARGSDLTKKQRRLFRLNRDRRNPH